MSQRYTTDTISATSTGGERSLAWPDHFFSTGRYRLQYKRPHEKRVWSGLSGRVVLDTSVLSGGVNYIDITFKRQAHKCVEMEFNCHSNNDGTTTFKVQAGILLKSIIRLSNKWVLMIDGGCSGVCVWKRRYHCSSHWIWQISDICLTSFVI